MKLSNSQRKYLLTATQTYERNLDSAKDYLETRGLSVEEAHRFHLGVVGEPLPGHEPYVGRLAIPYVTPAGVVDIRFRSMHGEEPKYLGMPGVDTTMFNAQIVLNAKEYICLCEGEIDTITLAVKSIHPAVGVPGVQNWKPFFVKILDDFERVLIFADGDTPGAEFGKKISRELSNVTVIHMPKGHDVNSIVQTEGIDWINERIDRCLARD